MQKTAIGKWFITLSMAMVCIASSVSVQAEFLDDSNFEIDTDVLNGADLIEDDGGDDWETFPHADIDNDKEKRRSDLASGNGDDAFGQGSKEDTPVPSIVAGSIPPNKSDLKTFGVYLEEIDAVGSTPRKLYLHLFWHRVQDPSGSTNMDFEFNQGKVLSANGVTPVRTPGDILIQYDLAGGGTVPELFLSYWLDGSEAPPATGADCEASNQLPCWGERIPLSEDDVAIGAINTAFIPATPEDETDGLDEINGLDPRTFGEATINFEALVPTAGAGCLSFGSAYLKSRSSDSFSSSLKDFIAPIEVDVDNCATLRIIKQDETKPGVRLNGASFEVWADSSAADNYPGGVLTGPNYSVDGKDDGAGGREANYSCTTPAPGTGVCEFTGVLAGDYWIVETAAPAGHDLASPAYQLKTVVAGGSDVEATFIDPRQPASVTINKKDDAGASLDGATFTLYNDLGVVGTFESGTDTAVSPSKTCTTSGGTCTISNILPPGNYCVDETTVPTGYTKAAPACFSLSLNQDLTLSDFVDNRQPASVTINKKDDAGASLDGATFTLYNDLGVVGTFESGTDTAVSPSKTCTTSGGTCTISNILPPGNYCVDETTVPSGYNKAAAQCFTVPLNGSVPLNFVDPRKQGAIKVTKTRKHKAADSTTDPHAGVTFTVTDRNGAVIGSSGTTNSSGVYCLDNVLFSQFAPGDGKYVVTETVPTGYSADQANPQEVTVDQEGSCSGGNEETLSFSNTPLTNFTISIDSQVDGGTQTVISCDNGAGGKTVLATAPANGDGSHTASNLLPGTYNCTITIDP